MKLLRLIGIALHTLAWPAYQVYLRLSERTRVVVVHQGKVLVMHQWIGTGRWSLPGGGLHRGEAPVVGALRELHEETGIVLLSEALTYVGKQQYRAQGQRFVYHVFAASLSTAPALHRQRHEVAELAWLSPDDLTSRTATPDTCDSLRLVRSGTRLLQ